MKTGTLRRKLFAKRYLLKLTGFTPNNSTSIERLEKPSDVNAELIGPYSDDQMIEIEDPRSHRAKKHFFEARSLQVLNNVILEPKNGFIYSRNGKYLIESTPWNPLHVYNSFPWNLSGSVSKLEIDFAIYITSNSYYHWLIEDLPSTIFCLEKYPNSLVLAYKNSPSYVRDFLEHLNREVIYIDGPFEVKSLLFVTKRADSGWPHPTDIQVLKSFQSSLTSTLPSTSSSKLYVSRMNSKRSPVNESEVVKEFESKGFLSLELEKLGFIQQIELLSNCTVVAGVHGAGLTNMIWMNSGSLVQDIANSNYWTECFHRLAHLNFHKYRAVTYEGEFHSPVDLKSISSLEF